MKISLILIAATLGIRVDEESKAHTKASLPTPQEAWDHFTKADPNVLTTQEWKDGIEKLGKEKNVDQKKIKKGLQFCEKLTTSNNR